MTREVTLWRGSTVQIKITQNLPKTYNNNNYCNFIKHCQFFPLLQKYDRLSGLAKVMVPALMSFFCAVLFNMLGG